MTSAHPITSLTAVKHIQKQLTPLLLESISNIFKNSTHPTKSEKKNHAPSYAPGTAWLFPFKIYKNSYGYRRNISTHNGNTLLDILKIFKIVKSAFIYSILFKLLCYSMSKEKERPKFSVCAYILNNVTYPTHISSYMQPVSEVIMVVGGSW